MTVEFIFKFTSFKEKEDGSEMKELMQDLQDMWSVVCSATDFLLCDLRNIP